MQTNCCLLVLGPEQQRHESSLGASSAELQAAYNSTNGRLCCHLCLKRTAQRTTWCSRSSGLRDGIRLARAKCPAPDIRTATYRVFRCQ